MNCKESDINLKRNEIHLMDGIEGLHHLERHSVDMLLTDPPYGTTQNVWDTPLPLPEFWEAVQWAVKPNGAILIFSQCPYDKVLGTSNLKLLRYEWIWCKTRSTGFLNARRAPLKQTETILVFYQKAPKYHPQYSEGKPYFRVYKKAGLSSSYGHFEREFGFSDGRRFLTNLLRFSSEVKTVHPTQKPVKLCEYLIQTYTDPGETVADICAGSGTTAVAAINTQRSFICFENNPEIYSLASDRIQQRMSNRGDMEAEPSRD